MKDEILRIVWGDIVEDLDHLLEDVGRLIQ